ncbi:MAG: hypothetical protein ABUL41_02420 [Chitinophagaceae bacterium]
MKWVRWDWIGIICFIAAVLAGVFAVIKTGGPGSIYIALAMIVVFGSMVFFFYKLIWAPRVKTRRLQKAGIHKKAKVLEVKKTNISVNNNPQVKLILEIKNDSGHLYTTSCRTIVSRLHQNLFQPGIEITVIIDPKNENNVVIDTNK